MKAAIMLPLTLAFVCALLPHVSSYFVNIDAHGEECFHDRVSPGTKMALMFEVADGGFLDIDVKVSIQTVDAFLSDATIII